MATFSSLVDKNDKLVIVPRKLAVLAAPYGTTIPTSLTDATGLIDLPAEWEKAGEISREDVSIGGDGNTENIVGYGSLIPRRVIKTEESMAFNFKAQETRKLNYELFFGDDLSDVVPDANGEWRAYKGSGGDLIYKSVILIGLDGSASKPIFPFWIFPKMSASSSGEVPLSMSAAVELPITLNAYEDPTFGPEGAYVAYGMAGAGAKDIQEDMGFSGATSITVTPATTSLSLSGTTTRQLVVTDNLGATRTSECEFVSDTTATATVASSGLITAVAEGTATVTVSLGSLTATCAVTVTA